MSSGPRRSHQPSHPSALRILAVGNMYPPHHAGGYELMWQAAMVRARELGHRVRVLTTDYRGEPGVSESEPELYRTLHWYWDHDRYDFPELSASERVRIERHNARELEHHLDEFRPHIVSWWSMGGMSLALIERARRAGFRAVLVVHDDWLIYGPRFDQWIRIWRGSRRLLAPVAQRLLGVPTRVDLADSGVCLFNSRHVQARAHAAGIRPVREAIVYPGIESDLRQPLPSRQWDWRLLYLGRIDHQKGIDTAVQALTDLPPQATLEVWGTGSARYIEELRQRLRQLALVDRVRFRGWAGPQERLLAYENADVVVFPVRWEEPFGLVPLEAMGVGRLVVSTARGGTAEYLNDGENALVFQADDSRGLASAVRCLADSEALRDRLREGGRRTAQRFTVERFADETVEQIARAARPML